MPGIHYRGDSSSSLDNTLSQSSRRPLVFIHGVGFGIVSHSVVSALQRGLFISFLKEAFWGKIIQILLVLLTISCCLSAIVFVSIRSKLPGPLQSQQNFLGMLDQYSFAEYMLFANHTTPERVDSYSQMPYLNFLWKIHQACPANPMIFLDIPHVALRPFHRAKSIDSLMSACNDILSCHGLSSASFVGHSFGSLCISRMCQLFPEAVDSIVSLTNISAGFAGVKHTFKPLKLPQDNAQSLNNAKSHKDLSWS